MREPFAALERTSPFQLSCVSDPAVPEGDCAATTSARLGIIAITPVEPVTYMRSLLSCVAASTRLWSISALYFATQFNSLCGAARFLPLSIQAPQQTTIHSIGWYRCLRSASFVCMPSAEGTSVTLVVSSSRAKASRTVWCVENGTAAYLRRNRCPVNVTTHLRLPSIAMPTVASTSKTRRECDSASHVRVAVGTSRETFAFCLPNGLLTSPSLSSFH